MFEVLQTMIVRSISLRPVRGSSSSGNSVKISTTSFARSPQATLMMRSAPAFFASACWSTVLPQPNGPGMNPVPPSAIGLSVSIVRTPVSIALNGRGLLLYPRISRLTGHFIIIVTERFAPVASAITAISSSAAYSPSGTIDSIVPSPS